MLLDPDQALMGLFYALGPGFLIGAFVAAFNSWRV